ARGHRPWLLAGRANCASDSSRRNGSGNPRPGLLFVHFARATKSWRVEDSPGAGFLQPARETVHPVARRCATRRVARRRVARIHAEHLRSRGGTRQLESRRAGAQGYYGVSPASSAQREYLSAARARAFCASSSRFFGGAAVSSERRSRSEARAILSTACWNKASFAFDCFVKPLIFLSLFS